MDKEEATPVNFGNRKSGIKNYFPFPILDFLAGEVFHESWISNCSSISRGSSKKPIVDRGRYG